MRQCRLLLYVTLALAAYIQPAAAALKLCNRTSYILYAATSAVTSPGSVTKGWTRITPGDCSIALQGPLTAQSYLVYARSSLAHSGPQKAWGGNFPVCIKDGNFNAAQKVTQPYCTGAGTFAAPFAPVDTGGRPDWTMNFDEKPALSLTQAQLVGVKRLLKDNGYAVGSLDAKPSKQTEQSLAGFRKKMHFADQAGNDDLFKALENEALKSTAPAGYTVCNDSAQELLVATGDKTGGKTVSRGWWTIAGGACARTITTPLKQNAVYLFAQRPGGAIVVSGPEKFCVANVAFQMQGAAGCTGEGFAMMGFAKTATGSLSGYVAHIAGNGLVLQPARHTGISK